jgi:hypothetical protein
MPTVISKTIMWVVWLLAALWAILMAHFLTQGIRNLNAFSRPFETFAIGMFVIPLLVCGGMRFWLARLRNPWLALVPYLIGLLFAWQAGLYGIFLLPDFCIVYQILSAILMLAYFPLFVRVHEIPPPLPSAKA